MSTMPDCLSDAAYVSVGSEQVSIIINWPVQSGCMADVCAPYCGHRTVEPLICHRGSVTNLCQLLLQSSSDFQGICTIRCSARTCEVYEQQDNNSTSYVATTRGKLAGEAFQHSLTLPAAPKVILRMLSLQHPGILHIHHVQLESSSDTDLQQKKPADQAGSLQQYQSRGTKSQQAEVQAMLQQMMSSGPPGNATAPADTHQKFMAALAKAALAQNKGQPSQEQPHECVQPATVTAQRCQMQPASPLIQEMPGPGLQGLVDAARTKGYLLQEAGTADTQTGDQDIGTNDADREVVNLFDRRLQLLEASSRRAERKLDQILEYCRTMAQAMSPA
ncbi:hypothetical protein ABBQ32_004649 [Trebouxia sp. C0010 RCD-2024]